MIAASPIDILLVEDSPGDVELVRQGLTRSRLLNSLHVVQDGVEAMDFLHHRGDFEDVPRPALILLDINLPRKNGHEVLRELRSDEHLRPIPVVILTTSDHERDILKAYEEHANAYVQKPLNATEFIDAVRGIEGFWFSLVRLPPETA